MNKRIKINGKLYEAISTTDVNDVPAGWSSDTAELGSSVTYHFRNKKLQIDVYAEGAYGEIHSITVHPSNNPTPIYYREIDLGDTADFNGLLKAVERGAEEMMDIVNELAPGNLFTMIDRSNDRDTRNLKAAMKHAVDREVNRW